MTYSFYKKVILITILYSNMFFHAQCQTVVNAAGNTLSDNSYLIEYSIGEISITTVTGAQNIISQGVLQPNIKILNPGCSFINDTFSFFPNPTRDKIRLVGRYNWINSYMVYAADGKLMGSSLFYNNYIDLSRFAAGLYFIQLLPGCDGKSKTLKILKQ